MNLIISLSCLDYIFLLLGTIIGVFYGFSGWNNPPNQLSFQSSPRVRNLKWSLGVATGGFLLDLRFLSKSPDYSKTELLLTYLLAFTFSAAMIIIFFCLVIYFQNRELAVAARAAHLTYNPVQDFVLHGHAYYRKNMVEVEAALEKFEAAQGKNQLERFKKKFLPKYMEQITQCITELSAGNVKSENDKKEFRRQVLRSMCAVIIALVGDIEGLKINANYMLAIERESIPPDFFSRIKFAGNDSSKYTRFLELKEYASENSGKESIILPVDTDETKVLIGAPEAFLSNRTAVIDNTVKIEYSVALDPTVTKDMKSYFEHKRKQFKSFASLVIPGTGGEPLGIVNIESNQEFVFGCSEEEKNQAADLLYPFCGMLSLVLK